ncbi:hypothetical protein T11_201 [Trichinella zimbabwensis]|uniref:Uncharacterized protein n=2 Tax=Trichinella zimbabwensis TaxID=268475 RepID=A0A0V1HJM3_9BILA|nr:hypothetical protein T11_201 [Trichinella zimbabwensis]
MAKLFCLVILLSFITFFITTAKPAITSSQQSLPQPMSSEFSLQNAYDVYEYNPKFNFVDMLGEKMNNFDSNYGLNKRLLVGKRKNHWVLWNRGLAKNKITSGTWNDVY